MTAKRWVPFALAALLSVAAACDQVDQLGSGIELREPPPSLDGGGMGAASSTEARTPLGGTSMVSTSPSDSQPLATAVAAVASPSVIASDTARITTVVSERPQLLRDADRAFASRSGCAEAVRLYGALPRPADVKGADGTNWVDAQLRIAQCSIELREWNRSLDAIALVKTSRPREWSAPYFEAQVYCQMGQFDRGTKTFRDLTGLLGTLGTGARQAVTLLSKYGIATCDRLDYESSRQPERNRDQLELFVGEYEEFINGTEALQAKAGLPAEYAREFATALKSARDHYAKYAKP